MRIYLTLFILVNLFLFATAVDRSKILNRQSRKHTDAVKNSGASQAKAAAKATTTTTTKTAAAAATQKTTAAADKADAKKTSTTTQAAAAAKAKTDNKAAAAASAKVFSKDASGKVIEHVTKEPAPKGMVRPKMIPSPDAIPNTYTVRPVVEGQPSSRMMSHRRSSPVQQEEDQPQREQEQEQMVSSSSEPQPMMSTPEQDDNNEEETEQPHFKTAAKKKQFGKDAVTAEEVSSLSNEAQAPDEDFPPKYPPCSCEAQPQPMCCPQPPYSQGWWHQNAAGDVHFHHVHTPDEDPEQVNEENAQTAAEDGQDAQDGQDGEDTTPPPSEEDVVDGAESSTGGEVPRSIANDPDLLSTGPAEPELTYSSVKALLEESLQKQHDSLVAQLTTGIDAARDALTNHIGELHTELLGQLSIIHDLTKQIATKLEEGNQRAVIVENNIHHHHHHHDDDEDDDDDDDDDSDDDDSDVPAASFGSTGASTIELLKSMEAQSEELTNKLDQADVLDAAAGNEDS